MMMMPSVASLKVRRSGCIPELLCVIIGLLLTIIPPVGSAAAGTLKAIDFSSLPGNDIQLVLRLSESAPSPRVFHTDNPARIALDLMQVTNGTGKRSIPVNVGAVQSVQAVEAGGRTRVVINLAALVPYTTRVQGNEIFVTLQGSTKQPSRPITVSREPKPQPYSPPPSQAFRADRKRVEPEPFRSDRRRIENVDFRRGEHGEGRLIITLSDPKALVDIQEEGRKVVVRLTEVELPPRLAQKLDVLDFATPVQTIESIMEGNTARIAITPISDEFDYSSYQTGRILTVELRPLTKAEKEEAKKKAFTYSGDKLTLNFQDIPVRSVLQILADFTDINIVASDTVQGNVTLRLEDVPWDQALELVLKSKGLGKRQEGNIIRVAPLDEINKQEKEELEAQKVVEDLEPLRTEIIQVNYTKAEDIKKVLVGTTERTSLTATGAGLTGGTTASTTSSLDVSQSVLSGRGNVTVDPRTNQLIVKDTSRNLERVRELIRQLDRPVRQVLVESRIVLANNDFTRELGARISLNRPNFVKDRRDKEFFQREPDPDNPGQDTVQSWRETYKGQTATSADMLVDLAAAAATASGGSIGLTVLKVGDYLLDLELSAAQIEGRGEIVSTPRLITADQTKAVIKQGVEIPYTVTSAAGGVAIATVQFKQAVLELNVTPHITPDDNILMDLLVRKDDRGQLAVNGVPTIDKREIETTAQVANGETVVLGGVFEGTQRNTTNKVPFLGDLPGIGFMFRRNLVDDTKRELLIFITPKVLGQTLSVR